MFVRWFSSGTSYRNARSSNSSVVDVMVDSPIANRGCVALSSMITRTPLRARIEARTVPLSPVPRITTSVVFFDCIIFFLLELRSIDRANALIQRT